MKMFYLTMLLFAYNFSSTMNKDDGELPTTVVCKYSSSITKQDEDERSTAAVCKYSDIAFNAAEASDINYRINLDSAITTEKLNTSEKLEPNKDLDLFKQKLKDIIESKIGQKVNITIDRTIDRFEIDLKEEAKIANKIDTIKNFYKILNKRDENLKKEADKLDLVNAKTFHDLIQAYCETKPNKITTRINIQQIPDFLDAYNEYNNNSNNEDLVFPRYYELTQTFYKLLDKYEKYKKDSNNKDSNNKDSNNKELYNEAEIFYDSLGIYSENLEKEHNELIKINENERKANASDIKCYFLHKIETANPKQKLDEIFGEYAKLINNLIETNKLNDIKYFGVISNLDKSYIAYIYNNDSESTLYIINQDLSTFWLMSDDENFVEYL